MSTGLQKIIWIASYPKSGNTWFRAFLANLLSGSDKPVNINELHAAPLASSRIHFDEYAGISSSDLTFGETDALRSSVYRKMAEEASETLFIKVHDAWGSGASDQLLFPPEITKGVVYIIRNPLDVAVSFAFHSGKTPEYTAVQLNDTQHVMCGKPEKLFNQLRQHIGGWSAHVKSWTMDAGMPLLVLRYEDLLTNAVEEFTKAVRFCKLDYSSTAIEKAVHNSDFHLLKEMESKFGFHEKPLRMQSFFRQGKIGEWQNYLGPELVEQVIDRNRFLMEKYGYLEENQ